jgi:hypothetical protein
VDGAVELINIEIDMTPPMLPCPTAFTLETAGRYFRAGTAEQTAVIEWIFDA